MQGGIVFWLAVACCIGLAGCSARLPPPAPAPAPPPVLAVPPMAAISVPAPVGEAREQTNTPNVQVVYRMAAPNTIVAPMPTGIVLLSPGQDDRNIAFCNAFFTLYLPAAEAMQRNPSINAFQTFWLLKSADAAARPPDCDRIVKTDYDYKRASFYLRLLGQQRRAGPVLLATSGANPATRNVVLDASRVHFDPNNQDDSFDQIARAWTVSAQSATQAASFYAAATPAVAKVAAPVAHPAIAPPASDCAATAAPIVVGHMRVEVKVEPDSCAAGAPTTGSGEASGGWAASLGAKVDPEKDPLVGMWCRLTELADKSHFDDIIGAALPHGVVVVGGLANQAVCNGLIAEGVHFMTGLISPER